VKHSSESILFGIDFSKLLQSGETLSGAPSVALTSYVNPPGGVPATGNTNPALVIGAPLVNTAAFVNDDGGTVAIGAGVQARLAGGVSPTDYVLTVSCPTTAGNTRAVVCTLQVRDA
jgi:hypothetical protein